MRKIMILTGIIAVLVLASGCDKTENNGQIIGGDKDEGGCLIGAGYSWCEAKQKCLRVWEENCTAEQQKACTEEAKVCPDGSAVGRTGPNCEFAPCPGETAANDAEESVHVCTEQESLATACTMEYMPVCGKSVLNTGEVTYQTFGNKCAACAAMKVVSYTPGECPAELCGEMTLAEAEQIAKSSECVKEGGLKTTHFCNEGTRTWWIDLDIQKEGCSPACVVNVNTKEAEINWRCTGLTAP